MAQATARHTGGAARAARLFGAAEALRASIGVPLWPAQRPTYDAAVSALRATLGDTAFEAAWAQGQAPSSAAAVAQTLANEADAPVPRSEAGIPLTPREAEVAGLIAQGLTSREMAERLFITEQTADAHAKHIREKLGLRSRAEIASWAIRHGLGSDQM